MIAWRLFDGRSYRAPECGAVGPGCSDGGIAIDGSIKPSWTVRTGRSGRKLFRCDRPVASPADLPRKEVPESPGLVASLLQAIHADPGERRGSIRHVAALREVWVGWWTRDEYGAIKGHVQDIGRGGARVVLAVRPPRKTSVWLYKDVDGTLVSIRGEVAGSMVNSGGLYAVRFRFAAPCPTILLQAVICD